MNSAVFRLVSNPENLPFANFSYTLYDLASGGKGWTQVKKDHPEILELSEPAYSSRIYELAFQEIRTHPENFISGIIKTWPVFFSTGKSSIYGFVGGELPAVAVISRLILLAAGLSALVWAFRHLHAPGALLLIAVLAGTVFSVPFVPPWEADRMRAYAATIPFYTAFPAVGVGYALSRWRWTARYFMPRVVESPGFVIIWSSAFLVFLFTGILIVRIGANHVRYAEVACPAGSEVVYARLPAGSFVRVLQDGLTPHPRVPDIRLGDFEQSLHEFMYSDISEEFANLQAPTVMANVYNLKAGNAFWLVSDAQIVPEQRTISAICGHWSNGPAKARNVFYAESFREAALP
jgi:hypothetical protein